jgi:hypothetical protein
MDCYKDFSPSRDAFFAIGDVRFLPSFLGAALIRHLFNNWLMGNGHHIPPRFSLHIIPNVAPKQ